MAWVNGSDEAVRRAAREAAQYFDLPGFIRLSLNEAVNEELPVERRVSAVESLRGGSFAQVSTVLSGILHSPSPQQLQSAAANTLAVFDDAAVAEIFLKGWTSYGPEVRLRVLEGLLQKQDRAAALLNSVASGAVQAASIDPVARIRLTQYPERKVRERAAELLRDEVRDRAKVVEEYKDALELTGDLERGKAAFEKHCAKCHLAQGERGRIGPDLSGVNNKSRDELLSHILDPSFDIEPRYANYVLVDKQGRIYDGLLVGETSTTVILRGELEDRTILRSEIAELRTSTVSLMPDGLEADMSRQDLADVIEYLRGGL
jgi:putative heme-binding domain-containing protein